MSQLPLLLLCLILICTRVLAFLPAMMYIYFLLYEKLQNCILPINVSIKPS